MHGTRPCLASGKDALRVYIYMRCVRTRKSALENSGFQNVFGVVVVLACTRRVHRKIRVKIKRVAREIRIDVISINTQTLAARNTRFRPNV